MLFLSLPFISMLASWVLCQQSPIAARRDAAYGPGTDQFSALNKRGTFLMTQMPSMKTRAKPRPRLSRSDGFTSRTLPRLLVSERLRAGAFRIINAFPVVARYVRASEDG